MKWLLLLPVKWNVHVHVLKVINLSQQRNTFLVVVGCIFWVSDQKHSLHKATSPQKGKQDTHWTTLLPSSTKLG